MNSSNSYKERQLVRNIAEDMFEEYCREKRIIGFRELDLMRN